MKTVPIFSDRIRNRIRLEGLRSVRIRVRISNIRYRILIRIFKSYIYDVDIQSYHIRHSWHYPYSNPNPNKNIKINVISVISVRILSVFIPSPNAAEVGVLLHLHTQHSSGTTGSGTSDGLRNHQPMLSFLHAESEPRWLALVPFPIQSIFLFSPSDLLFFFCHR